MTNGNGSIIPIEETMADKAIELIAYNAALKALSISTKAHGGSSGQIAVICFPDGSLRVHLLGHIGAQHTLTSMKILVDMTGKLVLQEVGDLKAQLEALGRKLSESTPKQP